MVVHYESYIRARLLAGFFFKQNPKANTITTKMATENLSRHLKTESAIAFVKQQAEQGLKKYLGLSKISSPLALSENTGLNDDLNGVEQPVRFHARMAKGNPMVIIHSLAKWKRLRLMEYAVEAGKGILTDMQAIRPDEKYSPMHSIFVDQWDWEQHIGRKDRTLSFLHATVRKVYMALRETEQAVCNANRGISPLLPEKLHFIHAEKLLQQYPRRTAQERESAIAKKHLAVFISGIGAPLSNGKPHDTRAPDYDDWSSVNETGSIGLNGDLIFWNPVLKKAFEISSMGIRVDGAALHRQLLQSGCPEKARHPFHRMLLDGVLPPSIGGGIGQSRVCMYMLRKKHIGEVQVGIWPRGVKEKLAQNAVYLL